jgi:FkbM family methyltransferase
MNLRRLHPENLASTIEERTFNLFRRWGMQACLPACVREFESFIAGNRDRSGGQVHQDLFVLWVLGQRRDGLFVEFGATDGVLLSNTLLLEREFGWSGVLAEPARVWHEALRQNRRCQIDHRCVAGQTGGLVEFSESSRPEYSGTSVVLRSSTHGTVRGVLASYEVPTVSLADLLTQHNAPREIDFLSVDTEGTEFEILSGFDFARWRVSVVAVEHNFDPVRRGKLRELLTSRGYRRCMRALSSFDDWYVLESLAAARRL